MLSDALLAASPEVLEDPAAEKGLGHMRGLVELRRARGSMTGFRLPGGVHAKVWGLG